MSKYSIAGKHKSGLGQYLIVSALDSTYVANIVDVTQPLVDYTALDTFSVSTVLVDVTQSLVNYTALDTFRVNQGA